MTHRKMGLFATAVAIIAATGFGVSSCNSNSSAPDMPGAGNSGKNPQVLDGPCNVSISITNCAATGSAATVGYNDDGDEVFTNLNTTTNAINCTFASPANVWRAGTLISFPATRGALRYESKDAGGIIEAAVDVQESRGTYSIFPTFTSSQPGVPSQYDAIIYNNGVQVGSQQAILSGQNVTLIPPSGNCVVEVHSVGWDVYQVNAQCAWRIGLNPCCTYQFRLPNGQIINGNSIKLVERNANGVYVYLQTSTITTKANVASYAIKAATAYLHN